MMLNILRSVESGRRLIDSTLISRAAMISVRCYSSDQRKQNKGVLYINLMDEEDKFIFKCSIDQAKRYAKKHDLTLINYEGPNKTAKTQQMQVLSKKKMSQEDNSESVVEKKASSIGKKVEIKKIFLKDSITDHDLDVKMKKIAFYLYKGVNIRVVINGFKADMKMNVLEKIKKKFVPHLAFKQIVNTSTQIKLLIVPEKTFAKHYEEIYKVGEQKFLDEDDENDIMDDDELEDMINEKLK